MCNFEFFFALRRFLMKKCSYREESRAPYGAAGYEEIGTMFLNIFKRPMKSYIYGFIKTRNLNSLELQCTQMWIRILWASSTNSIHHIYWCLYEWTLPSLQWPYNEVHFYGISAFMEQDNHLLLIEAQWQSYHTEFVFFFWNFGRRRFQSSAKLQILERDTKLWVEYGWKFSKLFKMSFLDKDQTYFKWSNVYPIPDSHATHPFRAAVLRNGIVFQK